MYSLVLFIVLIGSTISCKCRMDSTLSEDFQKTPIIFIGRVIKKAQVSALSGSIQYTMKVEEAFKGTLVGANVLVTAREQSASCGIGIISVGTRLQIWSSASGTTNSCTRTTTDINRNRGELRQLTVNQSP